MKLLLNGVGVVLFIVMVACWIGSVWTDDDRWGATGLALLIPVFCAFMGASLAPKGRQW